MSYFAELGVFATLREQDFSAVFTLKRQLAKFRKGETRTLPKGLFVIRSLPLAVLTLYIREHSHEEN